MTPVTNEEHPVTHQDDKTQKTITHPAFGLISLSITRGGALLFGSDVVHDEFITIRIDHAEEVINLDEHTDYRHCRSTDHVVEFNMSHDQFARFFSGVHEHCPCTISQATDLDSTINALPKIKQTPINSDFLSDSIALTAEQALQEIKIKVSELSELIENNQFDQVRLRAMHYSIDRLTKEIPAQLKFAVDQAERAIDCRFNKSQAELERNPRWLELKENTAVLLAPIKDQATQFVAQLDALVRSK